MAESDVTAGARDMAILAELVKLVDRIEALQYRVRVLEADAQKGRAATTNVITAVQTLEAAVKALSYAKADA